MARIGGASESQNHWDETRVVQASFNAGKVWQSRKRRITFTVCLEQLMELRLLLERGRAVDVEDFI